MLRFNFAETKKSKFKKHLQVDLLFSVLVMLSAYYVVNLQALSVEREINLVNSRISKLQKLLNELKMVKKDEKKLMSLKRELEKKLSAASKLKRRKRVPEFLYFFADPENLEGIWLNRLRYDLQALRIDASTLDLKYIPLFFDRLEEKIGSVRLKSIKRETCREKKSTLNYYRFSFDVKLGREQARENL